MKKFNMMFIFSLYFAVTIVYSVQLKANTIANWDISNCNFLFNSLKPTYLNHSSGDISVTRLQRSLGTHHCLNSTNNGKALRLNYGHFNLGQFNNNDLRSIRVSTTVMPHETGQITSFSFKEKHTKLFLHGYMKKYGLRVLKNGEEIYKQTNITTTQSWSDQVFTFSNNPNFTVQEQTTFTFEIFPHNVGGINLFGALWDIDQVSLQGSADNLPSNETCTKGFEVQSSVHHRKFEMQLPKPPQIDATSPNTHLVMEMRQSCQWLGLYSKQGEKIYTTVWGYSQEGTPAMHLGPTIIAKENSAISVEWVNQLPNKHLFPIPEHGHMARPDDGLVPTVTHLHGGHTEPESDGYPSAWYTRGYGSIGEDWKKEIYTYDNTQEAAPLWYHDHVLGMTRLNVNAGLAGMYLIRDDNELSKNLPSGDYEREIMIQDVQLDEFGQLARNSEFPAFFGDYVLVNGAAWPVLDVEPRKYRFRILNASDSRFYQLKLSNNDNFIQVGTDGGLINSTNSISTFLIAPGERYDMVIDFTGLESQEITLNNTTGILPGLPNILFPSTRELMKFRVGNSVTSADSPLPETLREPIVYWGEADNTRQVLLGQALDFSEGASINAPIIDLLGTVEGGLMRWVDSVTEISRINEVEVWEIYNTLLVPHPIHIHQVEFEIMDRQVMLPLGIDIIYTGTGQPFAGIEPVLIGPKIPPESYERGWKDEVIVPPLSMVRIKLKFDILGDFVWHCHLLTHEDHDMMRPLTVVE